MGRGEVVMEGKRKGRRGGGTGEKKQKRKQERRQYLASEKGGNRKEMWKG